MQDFSSGPFFSVEFPFFAGMPLFLKVPPSILFSFRFRVLLSFCQCQFSVFFPGVFRFSLL